MCQLGGPRAGKVHRGTHTEEQIMGDHPNLSTASMSAPAATRPDPVTLTGSNTTTSSRKAAARSSNKEIAHVPAPVRKRTKLLADLGKDPATLPSPVTTSSHGMAAGTSKKINIAPLARRTGKSNAKSPDPLSFYNKQNKRVLDHLRQLAANIKDYEVPESGGLPVELMEVVIGEFPDTASDPNVRSYHTRVVLLRVVVRFLYYHTRVFLLRVVARFLVQKHVMGLILYTL